MRAYRRNQDGTLTIITVWPDDQGIPCARLYPMTPTNETETLLGWPDGLCRIWTTDGGAEILVPEHMED